MSAFVLLADRRRDLPWALLLASAASWALLALWSDSELGRWLRHDYQPERAAAQLAAMTAYALGWTLMTLAMMAPAAAALLAAFGRVTGARALRLAVVCGFLGVWLVTGCAFRALDGAVHAAVERSALLSSRPELVAAAGLLVAGAFQFAPAKRRCLTACRSPRGFVYRRWGRGAPRRDALAIGASFGLSCVGCCWALMLVMFASSMSSFALMAALTGVMAAERARRIGDRVVRPVGAALVAAAILLAA